MARASKKNPEKQIVDSFLDGIDTLTLSYQHKLPHHQICDILSSYNMTPERHCIKRLSEEERNDLKSGMRMKDIEKKHNTSSGRLQRELTREGMLTRKQEIEKKHQEIVEMYKRDVPIKDICIFHEMSKSAVNRAISKYVVRDRNKDPEEVKQRNEQIVRAYKNDVKILDIAEQFDISESSIGRILKENNVKRLRASKHTYRLWTN